MTRIQVSKAQEPVSVDDGPTGEAARQPIPPEVAKLLVVQTAELRILLTDAVKADLLPIPIPKRLLSAWQIIRPEYPDLVHGYHPAPASLPEDLDYITRGGYWIQKAPR